MPKHASNFAAFAAATVLMAGAAVAQSNDAPPPRYGSPVGMEVRGDDGVLIGRVTGETRDRQGRLTGVEMAGLEPASAPEAERRRLDEAPLITWREPRRDRVRVAHN